MTIATAPNVAAMLQLSESDLWREALASLLREKKRQILQLRLEILSRYGVGSIEELETAIELGEVGEHPTWEDLIVAENLGLRLEEIDVHLADLRRA
ncbi:MAG: hypothetical protein K1X65_10205 [Caldilineales bacterium]|nr:hypothetical protein [Caldilineales bacterium]MCW5859515.1 hypothetical protein [Caldilineales bacterium]